MSTKFKNLNIGFMEYLEDTPNLKDSPNYAAIIGSDNNRGFCSNTNNGALTNCSGSGIWTGIKTGDKTETNSKIVVDKSDPTKFTCEGGNCCHSSTAQNVQSFHRVNGILQCQQSVSPPLPATQKYMCKQKTCEKITNLADYYGPLAQSQPDCSEASCDMHNTNVQFMSEPCAKHMAISGTTGDGCAYSDWSKYVNINSCDLIKENNGCNDLNNHYLSKIPGVKGSMGTCQLEKIKIPKGMSAQIYNDPPGWSLVCVNASWHDMCSTRGCNWTTGGSSPDGIHTTFAEVGNDGYNASDLGGQTCSIKFALTDKNQHACD